MKRSGEQLLPRFVFKGFRYGQTNSKTQCHVDRIRNRARSLPDEKTIIDWLTDCDPYDNIADIENEKVTSKLMKAIDTEVLRRLKLPPNSKRVKANSKKV